MPINAKLVVVGGEVKTAEIKLRLPSTIGRGRGCTIMLPQALVSRQHCEIFESSGKLMVRDLGSLNGTFVNNQKLTEPSPINSEELLSIGTVTFRVVFDAAGASIPPPGPKPVMKSSVKETLPAAAVAAPPPAVDNSEPLDIGDFDFDETVPTDSPDVSAGEKTPSGPIVMPTIRVQESTPIPAAPKPIAASANLTAAVAAPISALPSPPPPKSVLSAPAPVAKVIVPATAPPPPAPSKPALPPAKAAPPEAEEKAEEEDDFQDFLKSLKK